MCSCTRARGTEPEARGAGPGAQGAAVLVAATVANTVHKPFYLAVAVVAEDRSSEEAAGQGDGVITT